MNLWGFTPDFHKTLQAAMDAAVGASEESEVLLPEVVAQSLATSPFTVLAAQGRCVGVTHPDDLALVQAELNRQVAAGERPAGLWSSLRTPSLTGDGHRGPDATQPRVTVRPKPPVLLGATSTMTRWHRAGVVSDNPRPSRPRRLQGSHRDAPRTIAERILVPTPVCAPLAGLASGPRSRLAAFSRLPSGPPCGFSSGFPRSHLSVLA